MIEDIYKCEISGAEVYYADTSSLDLKCEYCEVSQYRKNKINKLRNERDKKLSLGAELLLIHALRQHFPDVALPLEFEVGEYGKPKLKNIKGLYFSLAHADNISVCAISDTEVGVDIENRTRISECISRKYFTERERQYDFSYIWTRKEAVAKADGRGLGLGIDTFDVTDNELELNEKIYKLATFNPQIGETCISLCVL